MRNPILVYAAISIISLMSCSKNNGNTNATTWTINGNTYTATKVSYDTSGGPGALVASNGTGQSIRVSFYVRPNYNANYSVVSFYYDTVYSATSCKVSFIDGPNSLFYVSMGKPGDVVSETIVNVRLRLSFSNIFVAGWKDSSTISGTIVQLTNN